MNLNKIEIISGYSLCRFNLISIQSLLVKKESKIKIATTYAEALFQGALQDGDAKAVIRDIDLLLDQASGYRQAIVMLANPLWGIDDKKAALKEVAGKLKLAPETLRCLNVMAENNRFSEFELILKAYRSLYLQKHNIVEVAVETVKKLSDAQDKALRENLKTFLKKDVLVNYVIKPEILGGLTVSFGSDMIDDSLKGKLNRLESIMKGGQ